MSTLADLLSDPGSWRGRTTLALALAADLGVDATAAEAIAATLADNEHARATGIDQLWELRQRMSTAQSLAGMGDFDWHIATDTNIWSDELFRIFGYLPGEIHVTAKILFQHLHPDDRDNVRAGYRHSHSTGDPYEGVQRIVRRDGELRFLRTNAEAIRDEHGMPVRMRGTSIDITDQVLAEQAREDAAIRLGDAGLRRRQASEINDNVVQGLAAAIYALELDDQPRVSRYLRQTLESASQMMTDLLDKDSGDEHADRALVRSAPASLRALDENG